MHAAALNGQASPASFDQSSIQEEMGDVVGVQLNVEPGAEATVIISGYQYKTTSSVHDTNQDGEVELRINTYEAGSPGTQLGYSASGPDELQRVSKKGTGQLGLGEYQLSLESESERDEAKLRLTSAQFGSAESRVFPGQLPARMSEIEANSSRNNKVARGDLFVATFEAEGIGGRAELTNPPGNNLVFAKNSEPGVRTQHTVQINPSANTTEFRTIKVDYTEDGDNVPRNLTSLRLQHIGIDDDSDGQIETSLDPMVRTVRTNSAGIVYIEFLQQQSIEDSERILLQYSNITNPATAGHSNVAVSIGSEDLSGAIQYGASGQGNLGNGVHVAVESQTGSEFVAPLSFEYISDSKADQLYLIVDTSEINIRAGDSLTVELSQTAVNADRREKNISTSIVVTEPVATMQTPSSQWQPVNGTLNISGNTTLAPNSQFWIQMRSTTESPAGFLYHYPTVVQADQTYETEINLQSIQHDGIVYIRPVNQTHAIGPTKQVNLTG